MERRHLIGRQHETRLLGQGFIGHIPHGPKHELADVLVAKHRRLPDSLLLGRGETNFDALFLIVAPMMAFLQCTDGIRY